MAPLTCPSRWLTPLICACSLAASAPAAPAVKEKQPPPSAEQVRRALDRTLDLDLAQINLRQALERIEDQTGVPFVLDQSALQQAGLDETEMLVTLKVHQATLRTALRKLLAPYNFGYAVIGDSVVVSTEDVVIDRQLKQRIDLDLEGVPLDKALKKLARETATNLVVDHRVAREAQGPVSLTLDDVPLEVAVRLMAELAGLKPVRVGNVLFVTSKATAAEVRADMDGSAPPPGREVGPVPVPPRPSRPDAPAPMEGPPKENPGK